MSPFAWSRVENIDEVDSPALLIYPDRAVENIRRMIAIAGTPARLRPHIKTHKLAELIREQIALGITRYKCATIAEAEMAAGAGASDVLLAYPPVGPKASRLVALIGRFPRTRFSALIDDAEVLHTLSKTARDTGVEMGVMLDIDCGQHRTGRPAGDAAVTLYRMMSTLPGLRAEGLHAYDGHIHDSDPVVRAEKCEAAFAPVEKLRNQLLGMNLPVPRLVAGGTPTFPIHARRHDVECSPGTCVLWDHGYQSRLPDLDFLIAALVLTRVISRPGSNLLCIDLGHKAIASENPHPRVYFPSMPEAVAVAHSEEHLVIESPRAGEFKIGDVLYGIPWHVCPTVALHGEAVVIQEGRATSRWRVSARERQLSV